MTAHPSIAPPSIPQNARERPFVALGMLLIVALVLGIYAQTGRFEFLEWDDPEYVRDNPHVLAGMTRESFLWALTSLGMYNWHPLTWWSHQLDVSLFGQAAAAMHWVNVLFHAANSLLVGVLLRRFGIAWLPALLASAIFAVHPLHVESVAWIAERKDVVSTLLLLCSLLAWDRYVRGAGVPAYLLALGLAGLGLMAKPMLVTLPALLLILDGWPYRRLFSGPRLQLADRLFIRRLVEKLPFLLLAAFVAWLTVMAQHAGGAIKSLEVVGFVDRLGNALLSYGTYLLTSLIPHGLSFMYVFAPPPVHWVALSAVALGGISWLAMRQKAAVLAGWLWFLVSLAPVIGLISIGDHARADRYMYIPMFGLLLMLAGGMPWASWLRRPAALPARLATGVALGFILVLTVLSHQYTRYWRDSVSLFEHALQVAPDNHIAHTLLALTYERRGQPEATMRHADAAFRLAPRSISAANAAVSASNAANLAGRPELARSYLVRAAEAVPGFAKPHYNLGVLALRAGDWTGAIPPLQKAIALDPGYGEAHNNLGVAYLKTGQTDLAVAAFGEALRIDPGNRQARNNLALAQGARLR